jgi:hypothetical protein
MADNKCRWGLVRTDCHEFVTEEQLLLDEFLAQVREALEAWDDPSDEMPELVIFRITPDKQVEMAEHRKAFDAMVGGLRGGSDG